MADVHTQINTPRTFRKELLHTALDAAETVKLLERLRKTKEQKVALKGQLKTQLSLLQKQVDTLKKGIPPLPTEFLQKQAALEQKPKPLQKTAEAPGLDHQSENDIAEIKKRLANLQL